MKKTLTIVGREVRWSSLLALLLIPMLIAGALLSGTWYSDSRLRKVEAAVVNLDEMVTIQGQPVPLGRQLSAALVDSNRDQNFTWVLADADKAQAGLASGRYAAVVTIPKNFSAAATSFGGEAGKAQQATITVETSPVTGISETALGQSIAEAAATAMNQFTTTMFLDNLFIGFGTMGKSLGEAADGARQLADGNKALSDGLGEASSGARQLAGGTRQLADGTDQLAKGVDQWAKGADQYHQGIKQYTDGVNQYVDGINMVVEPLITFVEGLPDLGPILDKLDPIMEKLPDNVVKLNDLVQKYGKQLLEYLDQVSKLETSTDQLDTSMADYASATKSLANGSTTLACPKDLAGDETACAAYARGVKAAGASLSKDLSGVTKQVDSVAAQADALEKEIPVLKQAIRDIMKASQWLADNADEITKQWKSLRELIPRGSSPNEAMLKVLKQLRDGGYQLKDGGKQLTDGAKQLAGGAKEISKGTKQLAKGADQIADGTDQLAGGLTDAASGSKKLADGNRQLADGLKQGADQIPNYSKSERENLAKVVASPISTENLNTLVMPNVALGSLLLVVALWLGAMASTAVIRPVAKDAALSSDSTGSLWGRRFGLLALVGLLQGVLVMAVAQAVMKMPAGVAWALAAVAVVASIVFAAINQALAGLLGTGGRVTALIMLLVTAVTALSFAAPGVFDVLRPLSPVSTALDVMRAVMTGNAVALPLVALVGWGLLGVGGAWLATSRARVIRVKDLAPTRA